MIKKVISVFITVFCSCLFAINYFNHFFAQNELKRDAEQLIYQFHGSLDEAREVLNELTLDNSFKCQGPVDKTLAANSFDAPAVRWLAVYDSGGKGCSSDGSQLDFNDYRSHKIDEEYAIYSSDSENIPDILLTRVHNGSQYFADLNPFLTEYMAGFACVNCLEYEIKIGGEPELTFVRNTFDEIPAIEYSTLKKEAGLDVSIIIRGTDDFLNYYRGFSWALTVVVAGAIAFIIAFFVFRVLSIRQSLERLVKDAIANKEFVPFYQPIVDTRTNETIGAEVLVRWRRIDGSVVSPNDFVPFSERTGLIIEITKQVIEQVGKDLVRLGWNGSYKYMSINIVAEHLTSDDLYHLISRTIDKNRLHPRNFALEITERRKVRNLKLARDVLERFYQIGIKLKLDDAGTGYGSFSYIQELGISTLKIDKMFVDAIMNVRDVKNPILGAIISFAKSSHIDAIAEGVETEFQLEYLKSQGVFHMQGFLFSKPLPVEEFMDWLPVKIEPTSPYLRR